MKIYILNYSLHDLDNRFLKFQTSCVDGIQIYSDDGIIFIDNNTTHKLSCTDNKIQTLTNYYNGLNLAIDSSIIKKEVTTQIPPDHLAFKVKIITCKKHINSKISLIITRYIDNNNDTTINTNTKIKYTNEIISIDDFYFDVPDNLDVNDIFVKEELIEFLSMLN